jgi:pyridoxine kinase
VQGIAERGVLGDCDGVLSGYLGSLDTGEAVIDAVGRVKDANPAARYCCDPVIGDAERGVFVRRGIPQLIKERMLAIADTVTPNQFELGHLAGRGTATLADLAAALDAVHACGPRVVLVTSLAVDDTPPDALDLVVSEASGRWRLRLPRLPIVANGAGDAIAALFFAHHLRAGSAAEAMALSASAMFGVLSRTAQAGAGEMLLVEAQDEFVAPSRVFVPHRV